ncbi:MAG TPA: substrate-binding domain-containing protein [Streptosporangiaceae bacterium]|nr:substrate-binding domain-containing protein [Streptosporangiaceae bacterium]
MTLMHRSPSPRSRPARLHLTLAAIACIGLAGAGCSSASSSTPPGKKAPTGEAKVAYASSLDFLNQKLFFPAYTKATGFNTTDWVNSAGALAQLIAVHEIAPNVFEAVGAGDIQSLEPKFTTWAIQFAGTQIAVAYNPKSKYASQFKAIASGKEPMKDLFSLMEKPGFRLGRTDPNIDPQGRAFIYMLELAQAYYHLPKDTVTKILGGPLASSASKEIYSETSLDATLASGQLDASSAYITQARELHLDYIALPPAISLGDPALANQYAKASITVTSDGQKSTKTGSPLTIDITLIGKPTAASTAFVTYVLSSAGLAIYKQGGFALFKPIVIGSGVPGAITSELGS